MTLWRDVPDMTRSREIGRGNGQKVARMERVPVWLGINGSGENEIIQGRRYLQYSHRNGIAVR